MMQGLLTPRKASEVHDIQEQKAAEFISKLAHTPADLRDHVRWCVAQLLTTQMSLS